MDLGFKQKPSRCFRSPYDVHAALSIRWIVSIEPTGVCAIIEWRAEKFAPKSFSDCTEESTFDMLANFMGDRCRSECFGRYC